MKNVAVILASGNGSRSGLNLPKQFFKIEDKTLLEIVVSTFDKHDEIDEIVVVVNEDYVELAKNLLCDFSKVKMIVKGGLTRQESSYNGVTAIKENDCNVLIHDAARVFVSKDIISKCIKELEKHEAVCTVTNSTDTVFKVDDSGKIVEIPVREMLRCAQTPQCFRLSLIKQAHEYSLDKKFLATDDCGLVLNSGLAEIYTVSGNLYNCKITYKEDFEIAKQIYQKRLDLKKGSC